MGGGGPCCWWWLGEVVFRCRGGSERGLGPPCPLPVPDQGFGSVSPWGRDRPCPQAFVSQVAVGGAGPGLPHLSPGSAFRFEGLWSGGGVGPGFWAMESPCCPACPSRPLGQLLSGQLLLQVPVFRRPHSAGVGGTQRGPRSPVFLRLGRLLLHLHLVATGRRDGQERRGGPGPSPHPSTLTQTSGTAGCPSVLPTPIIPPWLSAKKRGRGLCCVLTCTGVGRGEAGCCCHCWAAAPRGRPRRHG